MDPSLTVDRMRATNPLLTLMNECVVRVDGDGEFRGTGFFVAPGQVLTCAHVVHAVDEIAVSGAGWHREARVLVKVPELESDSPDAEFYPAPDLALLAVEDPPPEQPTARLAAEEPAGGSRPDVLYLYGYSLGEYGGDNVSPSAASVEYRGRLEAAGQTLFKLGGDQVLRGYSGCPVLNLRTGSVCAVIDSTRDAKSDLGGFGVPVAAAASALEGLMEGNREDPARTKAWKEAVEAESAAARRRENTVDLPLLPPMVELRWDSDSPQSQLLKPRFGVVELLEREQLQAHLMRWREGTDRLRVLLVTGGGGFGKTRLALEECARAKQAGWSGGLLAIDHDASIDRALQQLAEWPERLYVAIDYAETRPSLVASLLLRLARRIDGPPVRLILVCRQVQSRSELEELFATGDGNDEVGEVISRAEPVRLDQHTLDNSRLFEVGRKAFAEHLAVDLPPKRPPSLREAHFKRPLFVLAAALLAAQNPEMDIDSMSQNGLMLELLDRHESQYWNRLDDELGVGLDKALQARAVAVATVLGAEAEQEALDLAGVVLGPDSSGERRRAVARWLGRLYGDGRLDTSPAITPIEPDMLAEALVAREYTARPDLLSTSLEAAGEAQLERALGVLTKASSGNPQLVELYRSALDKQLPSLATRAVAAGGELVAVLDLAISSLEPAAGALATLGEVALEGPEVGSLKASVARLVSAQASKMLEEEPSERTRKLQAWALSELSVALSERGQAGEALATAEEAVELRRQLVAENREENVKELAGALNNLSNRLDEIGDPGALDAIQECLALRRELGEESARDRAEIAVVLNNLAGVFGKLGEKEKALEAVVEAADHYRALADADPKYLPDLAMAQNNRSIILGDLGRIPEAVEAAEEATSHYRKLARADPARHIRGLTVALNNLSTVLPDLGRESEALEAVEEAIGYLRTLVEKDPEPHLAELSGTLNNLSNRLDALGRWGEALAAIEEAVGHYRVLVRRNPDVYRPDLAMSLSNMANRLTEEGRLEEAVAPIREAVDTYRLLVERNRERYLPLLAVALSNMATVLSESGRFAQALKFAREAVETQRKLVDEKGVAHEGELATSLSNISVILSMHGRGEEARQTAEQAVQLYRVLAVRSPSKYHSELATSLTNLGSRLFEDERLDEALEVVEEAVRHLRALNAQSPARYLPDLTTAMNNLGRMLSISGQHEQALGVCQEVIERQRPLAKKNPGRYLVDLSISLNNLARISADLDRAEEAKATLDDIVREHGSPIPASLLLSLGHWYSSQEQLGQAIKVGGDALEQVAQAPQPNLRLAQDVRAFLCHLREAANPGTFDELWQREIGEDLPLWLRYHRMDKEHLELVMDWVETPSWKESRSFLESHPELLSDRYEAALDHIAHKTRYPQFLLGLQVLRVAREEGIPAAYRAVDDSIAAARRRERLEEWMKVDLAEIPAFLDQHREELLQPQAEEELTFFLLHHPHDDRLLIRLGLLGLAKAAGPAFVQTVNERLHAPLTDEECADPAQAEILPLTRLRAGSKGNDPEAQLQHAIAAAAVGAEEEAQQAIERCGTLLASWELNDYRHRLEDLAKNGPKLDELRDALTGAVEEAPD